MFNRVAQRESAPSHYITSIMSRSKKRTPITYWVGCKSQKRGKQVCNRKFRRKEHQTISMRCIERLPYKSIEIMDPWDLGGDGKCYYHGEPTDEWFIKLMRK